MSFGIENCKVQTGVFGISTLWGGCVVFNVLLHCGRATVLDDLKEVETLLSGMAVKEVVAVVLQSV